MAKRTTKAATKISQTQTGHLMSVSDMQKLAKAHMGGPAPTAMAKVAARMRRTGAK